HGSEQHVGLQLPGRDGGNVMVATRVRVGHRHQPDSEPLCIARRCGASRGGPPYANRSLTAKGMIHAGDAVVRAFASVGWGWGGSWSGTRDYQHFSATGR